MDRYNFFVRKIALILAFLLAVFGPIRAEDGFIWAKGEYSDKQYSKQPVETLGGVQTSLVSASAGDTKAGERKRLSNGTGYFRAQKKLDRWWLIDPDGFAFYSMGVNSIRPGTTKFTRNNCKQKFGNTKNWARLATGDLRELGFNTVGSWSALPLLREVAEALPYCSMGTEVISDSKAREGYIHSFAKEHKIGYFGYGHWKYPDGCLPVFHPDFATFCNKAAADLQKLKNDPLLIGYFTDNELPFPELKNYLMLDPQNQEMRSTFNAAWTWFRERKGEKASIDEITKEDEDVWAQYVLESYFQIVTSAIRSADPNHLILGSRFHGRVTKSQACFRAAARYVDVISMNLYRVWQPDQELFSQFQDWADKPVLVTEWYAKAVDSGLSNRKGAGWLVKTQGDRALFYQTFALGLMRQTNCVGFHWFRYTDDDADETGNLNDENLANKGIYDNFFTPYAKLTDAMRLVNRRAYTLIELN